MASSSSSVAREVLAGYVAGHVRPERVVAAVADAYYRDRSQGARDALRPVIEIIERGAPGVVDLTRTQGGAGFDIRLAERPFPKQYEPQLRRAAEAALAGTWGGEAAGGSSESEPGLWSRVWRAVSRLFSASA